MAIKCIFPPWARNSSMCLSGISVVGTLIGVDAVLLALEKRLADALRGVPIAPSNGRADR